MIEATTRTVEGVRFIADAKIVEPREKRNGVYVESVTRGLLGNSELGAILTGFGMRKVGEDWSRDCIIYAFYPWGYWQYKVVRHLLRAYWWSTWFLYDNARVFKGIPPGEMFSWRYFTPYRWVVDLIKKIKISESK